MAVSSSTHDHIHYRYIACLNSAVLPSKSRSISGDSRGSGTLSAYLRPMRSPWGRGRGQRRQPLRTPTARTRRSREIAQICKYVQCVRQARTSAIIAGRSWRNSPHCHNGSPSSTSGEGTSERLARAEPTEPQKGTMDADDYPPAEYSSAACQINEVMKVGHTHVGSLSIEGRWGNHDVPWTSKG